MQQAGQRGDVETDMVAMGLAVKSNSRQRYGQNCSKGRSEEPLRHTSGQMSEDEVLVGEVTQ
jgi:hypothetical protein